MKQTTKMAALCCATALTFAMNSCSKQEAPIETATPTAAPNVITKKKTRAVGFFALSKPNSSGVSELLWCDYTNNISYVPFGFANPAVPLMNANNPTGLAYRLAPGSVEYYLLHKPSATANWRISRNQITSGPTTPMNFITYSNINNSANLKLADLEYDPYYSGTSGTGPRFVMLDKTQPGDARILSVPLAAGSVNFVPGLSIKNTLGASNFTDPQGLAVVTNGTSTLSYEVMDVRNPSGNAEPIIIHLNASTFNPLSFNTLTANPSNQFVNGYSLVWSRYIGHNKMYYCGEVNGFNKGNNTTSVVGPWQFLNTNFKIEDLASQE
jgi:hypothetical protein